MKTQGLLDSSPRPIERLGFAALLLLILAPIVVQGIGCPLFGILDAHTNALSLTYAALGVAGIAWLVHILTLQRQKSWYSTASASFSALVFGAILGTTLLDIITAILALLPVAVLSSLLLPRIVERLPREMDGLAPRRKVTTILVLLLSIAAIAQISRLSSFMGDHKRAELSLLPTVPFVVNHSCLTAYVEAARLTTENEPNIYNTEHWPDLSHSERSVTNQKPYAPFALDAFAYPPPFLLLPRLLLLLPNFLTQRAAWFVFNGLLLTIGLWTIANWIDDRRRLRIFLLAPLVLICLPTILSLQIGNVHAAVVVLAMLAMVAFESKRPALGGAMLAFAIASKLSPGLLVIVLLVQRRYREVLWTAGFGLGFVLLSLLVIGPKPFETFLTYQLPMLSSGKALGFLADDANVPINLGPFGIPFKLAFLGVSVNDPWKAAKYINQIFTLAIIAITVIAARKNGPPQMQATLWLAILTLGTLRSPFAPIYIAFPVVWLLSVTSTEIRSVKGTIVLTLVWLVLSSPIPLPARQLAVFTLVQQAVLLAFLMYSVFRKQVPNATNTTLDVAPSS